MVLRYPMGSRSKILNLPDDIVNSILLEYQSNLFYGSKVVANHGKILHDYSMKVLSMEASISADSKVVSLDQPNIPGFSDSQYYFLQVHSCDGLVFIYHPGNMMLWNPAIRKYKLIPVPATLQRFWWYIDRIGFVYDFVAEDYKVLCVYEVSYTAHPRHVVEIYSVKNQSWRTISNFPIPPDFGLIYHYPISLNSVVHIMATSDDGGTIWERERLVISFYPADETFIVTPVPSNIRNILSKFCAFAIRVCVFGIDLCQEMWIWSQEKDGKTGLLTWNHIMNITLGSVTPYYFG
ncbi:uncharacterized protein LOC132611649 [Lycium barbarum]|uniref:uncharacterized protein LOC132611649 n=1 Tax=Lycium barbarum TaxID=112863 RepID=UPI00293E68BD|nr:uncharacterized protein LOC132611649 [Lycium barbarum]